jgi:hypothetical protein
LPSPSLCSLSSPSPFLPCARPPFLPCALAPAHAARGGLPQRGPAPASARQRSPCPGPCVAALATAPPLPPRRGARPRPSLPAAARRGPAPAPCVAALAPASAPAWPARHLLALGAAARPSRRGPRPADAATLPPAQRPGPQRGVPGPSLPERCPLRAAPAPARGVPALGVARVASARPRALPFTPNVFPRAQPHARGDYPWFLINFKLR